MRHAIRSLWKAKAFTAVAVRALRVDPLVALRSD
jgi:hypothetical protein